LEGTDPLPAVSEEVTLAFQRGEDYRHSALKLHPISGPTGCRVRARIRAGG
jgi:hypothetical protein